MTNEFNPAHYTGSDGVQVIDLIEAAGLGRAFCIGNAIKYLCRAGKKEPGTVLEDLGKALWYLARERHDQGPLPRALPDPTLVYGSFVVLALPPSVRDVVQLLLLGSEEGAEEALVRLFELVPERVAREVLGDEEYDAVATQARLFAGDAEDDADQGEPVEVCGCCDPAEAPEGAVLRVLDGVVHLTVDGACWLETGEEPS